MLRRGKNRPPPKMPPLTRSRERKEAMGRKDPKLLGRISKCNAYWTWRGIRDEPLDNLTEK